MKIPVIILFTYFTLTTMGFIYFLIFEREAFLPSKTKPKYFNSSLIGAFFTLFYILSCGFVQLLAFIPNTWGSGNAVKHWFPTRETISITLSLAISFYFFIKLNFYLIFISEAYKKEERIQEVKKHKLSP